MNVLVTHECSSIVAAAFRARGHNAWSNDILPSTRPGWRYHLQMDYRQAIEAEQWDLLIGHPVCTYLCNSGVGRLHHTPPNPSPGVPYGIARWDAMREAAEHFRWLLKGHKIKRVALENPVMHGHALRLIGTPATQFIQPYQFGDNASKLTGLWLRNLEPLEVPHESQWVAPRIVNGKPRWANQTDSGQNKLPPSEGRAAARAETYPGIANAMAEKWGA